MRMFRSSKQIAAALILGACLLLIPAAARANYVRLVFKDEAVVTGPKIRLKHVLASISGAAPTLKTQIGELVLDEAPAPGQIKVLSPTLVNGLLAHNSLRLDRVQAQIPRRITVSRPSQVIDSGRLAALFRQAVEANLPWAPEEVVVEEIDGPGKIVLPKGKLDVSVTGLRPEDLPGRAVADFRFRVDGVEVSSCKVSGLVKFYERVVVAARPLPRQSILKEGDLKLVRFCLGRDPDRLVNDPGSLVGLRLIRPLRAGQPIRESLVDSPPLVRRGDRVTLIARSGALTIKAAGMVLDQHAARGDQVRVTNLATRREVIGQVVDGRTVRVHF